VNYEEEKGAEPSGCHLIKGNIPEFARGTSRKP
jgi:hypothetical protein